MRWSADRRYDGLEFSNHQGAPLDFGNPESGKKKLKF